MKDNNVLYKFEINRDEIEEFYLSDLKDWSDEKFNAFCESEGFCDGLPELTEAIQDKVYEVLKERAYEFEEIDWK